MIRCLTAVLLTMMFAVVGFAATPEALFQRIRNNDLTGLKQLLDEPDSISKADSRSTTPLHYAAAFGSAEAVRMLLDAGADVNARNASDATPLILAAYSPKKVAALLSKGADPKMATKAGRTALHVAASIPSAGESVRLLLDKGLDVNQTDQRGTTALIEATVAGRGDIARLLLERGAKPDAIDGRGATALMEAVVTEDLGLVKLLLSKGANVNASSTFGGQVKHGPIALTKLTPLMLAVPYASVELVKVLISAGAELNVQDGRGLTPLMAAVASENSDPGVIDLLIASGANVNAFDPTGDSVLDWARKYEHPRVLKSLERAGAKGKAILVSRSRAAERPVPAVNEAVFQAVALLQRSSSEFFKQSGCVGCHHQPLTDIATQAANKAGVKTPTGAMEEHVRSMLTSRPLEPALMQMVGPGGGVDSVSWLLLGLHAKGAPANSLTDAIVQYVANSQADSGAWASFGIARAPFEGGTLTRTSLAIRVLSTYGWPARQAEFEERLARAREWLRKTEPRTTYERADQLLGLKYAGANASDLARVAAALRREQRSDGGWSQTRYLSSDAYATGLALHALHEAGQMQPTEAVYKRGVAYLLKTQLDDGSWYVRSRSPKFQPYFQSGFPHDHDQWISSAATAYAVMGLAPAAGPSNVRRAQR